MTALEVLTQCAWKGSVLLGAGFAAAMLLRRRSAALRHSVWAACLAATMLLPLAVVRLPRWAVLGKQEKITVAANDSAISTVASTTVTPAPTRPAAAPRSVPLEVWMAGAGLAALWFLAGIAATIRLVRAAAHTGDATELARSLGIGRRVRLLTSGAVRMPMTWGVLRPVVVLPESADEWPAARMRTVLLHELVHVRRFDVVAQALGQAVCCLYWFHPLAWIAAKQLRKERERACDDAVLARGVPGTEYAMHLMELVRAMSGSSVWSESVAMAEGSGLESRIRALLDPKRDRRPLSRWKALTIAAAGVGILAPVAALSDTRPVFVSLPAAHVDAPPPVVAQENHPQRFQRKQVTVAVALPPVTADPQGIGVITGVVRDPSGAVVPRATVKVYSSATNTEESATTDEVGQYRFPSLAAGRYTLEVEAQGFAKQPVTARVEPGSTSQVNVNLRVGAMSEVVEVKGVKPAAIMPAPQVSTSGRIRVGGNLQPARVVRQAKPEYPAELQQQGIEGTVTLRAIISKQGEPLSIQIVGTGVDERLGKAAAAAVAQWRYQPALLNGEPVEVMVSIDVAFTLGQ